MLREEKLEYYDKFKIQVRTYLSYICTVDDLKICSFFTIKIYVKMIKIGVLKKSSQKFSKVSTRK